MKKRHLFCLLGLLACTVGMAFASGKKEGDSPEPTGLIRRTSGPVEYWQDVDALSSASLLKASPSRFGYVDEEQGRYYMKIVDVNNPGALALSAPVPDGHNVAMWTVNNEGKIAVVTADQYGRSEFKGRSVVIFNANLQKEAEFPFGNPTGAYAQPLSHREPGLAFTDKYVVIGWNDNDGTVKGEMYITVYALADGKSGSIQVTNNLGIGNLSALAVHDDYIIVGGSTATRVCKISTGSALNIEPAAGTTTADGAGGCHWIKSNESYALESVQGKGTVRVWKWQGDNTPTLESTVSFDGDSSGSVQAMSFGVDDPDSAYIFGKVAGGSVGKAYKIDLASLSGGGTTTLTTPIFTKTTFGTESTGQMWIIERAEKNGDVYYALAGGVGANENGPSGFLFLKNPIAEDGDYADNSPVITYNSFNWFWTLVRSARLLKNDSGDIFFVAKNHAAREAYEITPYRLRVQKIND
ncbi:MAG: lactonase family protein [Treponema sp.]|jgi:hypothetical protein|nr:lactonase family protein [Treponema sp.]